jgi:L-ascorbate metabolism protein UlaG (beta-lactamase superfamily)
MSRSPHFRDGIFHNTMPSSVMPPDSARKAFQGMMFGKEKRKPAGPVPIVRPDFGADGGPDGLHVVWLGHASTLVEIEGRRVLIDPVWSLRCSPTQRVGPKRLHPMPLTLAQLPALDAVVISHDHYDHLDMATVQQIMRLQRKVPFLVPLGVGTHLRRWGVPGDLIVELDWDEEHAVGGLRFVATEARHFSGRGFRRNETLWGSWVIAGRDKRVFYTGDTGYFPGFAELGRQHGPFDLTIIQAGMYSPYWPDIHMTPDEAIRTHLDLQGGLLLPVHWATFTLALHSWSEPVDWIWRRAKEEEIKLTVPRPGERVDVAEPQEADGWWQGL